jgi:hypothetical protein
LKRGNSISMLWTAAICWLTEEQSTCVTDGLEGTHQIKRFEECEGHRPSDE